MRNAEDLLQHPVWQAGDLGRPLPDGPHGVSLALPRWQDVVDYEEHRPEVVAQLQGGYPRFVIHPLVQEVARRLEPERPCLPLPSLQVATQAVEFCRRQGIKKAEVVSRDGMYGVVTSQLGYDFLGAFWQHTGLIVSTRQATAWLEGRRTDDGAEVRRSLRRQLAELYQCAEGDVFLTPTGMAAQFAALQAVQQRRPGLPTAQLGFPYVDTLKLQQKFGAGANLLHDLQRMPDDLHQLIHEQPLAACFCEIPGNPLLGSADLPRIHPLLREHHVPLLADDVVATPFNVDLSDYADLVATSLTKFVAGTGDVMGGALICNPRSPFYGELKPAVQATHEDLLWVDDAEVLDRQIHSFPARMAQHNTNGLFIAEQLRTHPAVARVWYPRWEFNEEYEAVRRAGGGYGSLVTFLPHHEETASPQIYDRLAVCKGPSLGTIFTLACPFTLLAHYTELDWAETCGVSRYLIRISVGLEEPQELWHRIEAALAP